MAMQANNSDEHQLIADNFSLLLENRERVLSHAQMGKAWSPAMYLSHTLPAAAWSRLDFCSKLGIRG